MKKYSITSAVSGTAPRRTSASHQPALHDRPSPGLTRDKAEAWDAIWEWQPRKLPSDLPASPSPNRPTRSRRLASAGIDTIRLVAPFRVQGQARLQTIYDRHHPERNRLLWESETELAYGVMAKCITPEVQVRVSPPRGRAGAAECWITFSVPKLIRGCNAPVLTASEFLDALYHVQDWLLERGLVVDVFAAKVSRVDVFRNLSVPRPVRDYMPLLCHLGIKHEKWAVNYETGLLRSNKSQQLALYDKRSELRYAHSLRQDDDDYGNDDYGDGSSAPDRSYNRSWNRGPWNRERLSPRVPGEEFLEPGAHILRQEWRLRNARTVRSQLDVHCADDLLRIYGSLSQWLDDKIRDNLFRDPLPEADRQHDDVWDDKREGWGPAADLPSVERWRHLLANADSARHIENLLLIAGYEYLTRGADEAQFRAQLKQHLGTGSGRSAWDRLRNKLRRNYLHALAPNGTPYSVFYRELMEAATTPQNTR